MINNRITELFKGIPSGVVSIFFTAGFPKLNDTITICNSLQDCGVDMIEIGFPFSDPIADGPTIQHSNEISLANGMTLSLLFSQLSSLRECVSIPVLLMGYFNVVLKYGIERFCKQCSEISIDGVILPDLPMDEYQEKYRGLFEKYSLSNVFLVTPSTSEDRIREIDQCTQGFIYLVSSSSTTGGNASTDNTTLNYISRVKNMGLRNPYVVGFGVSNREEIKMIGRDASGVVIGSAFIRSLENAQDLQTGIKNFAAGVL